MAPGRSARNRSRWAAAFAYATAPTSTSSPCGRSPSVAGPRRQRRSSPRRIRMGGAPATASVAAYGDRLGRRRAPVLASALSAGGLAVVAVATRPAVLAVAALLGMVNGMGRDRGPAQTIDQSLLAGLAAFTRYTFVQDVLGALGSLAAAIPAVLATRVGLAAVPAYRRAFCG